MNLRSRPCGAATDLGQTPADMVFLSFSDSELRLLSRMHAQDADELPSLRCAPLAQLKHPYSVDLYLDTVARHAKLIVVRLLGGNAIGRTVRVEVLRRSEMRKFWVGPKERVAA